MWWTRFYRPIRDCFCDYWACASSHYCHRDGFPKVSNNRIYFGGNQHTKITNFRNRPSRRWLVDNNRSCRSIIVDDTRNARLPCGLLWKLVRQVARIQVWKNVAVQPNENAVKYIISQEAYLHFIHWTRCKWVTNHWETLQCIFKSIQMCLTLHNKCMALYEYPHKDMAYVAPLYHFHFTLQQ